MDRIPSASLPQNPSSGRDPALPPSVVNDGDDHLKLGLGSFSVPQGNRSNIEDLNNGQNVANNVQPDNPLTLGGSSGAGDGQNPASDKLFTCIFCMKSFATSQALGGHQNAHRQERQLVRNMNAMHEEGQQMLMGPNPYHPEPFNQGFRPIHHMPPPSQNYYPFQPSPPFGIHPQNHMTWQGGGGRPTMPSIPPQYPNYQAPMFDGPRFNLGLNNNNNNSNDFDIANPFQHFARVPSWKSRATEQRLAYEFRPYTQHYRGPRRTAQPDGPTPSNADNGQGSSANNGKEQGNNQQPVPAPAAADDNPDEELDLTLRL